MYSNIIPGWHWCVQYIYECQKALDNDLYVHQNGDDKSYHIMIEKEWNEALYKISLIYSLSFVHSPVWTSVNLSFTCTDVCLTKDI